MSVIVDTTKAEIEMAIKYARVGANNCMIGHTWKIEELVRCGDCAHNCGRVDGYICCDKTQEISIWHSEDWFCKDGEREDDGND